MYHLKEIEKYTNGKIINGNPETKIEKYSLLKENHKSEEFFIPILFREINREDFIIDAVKSGAIGFMINKASKNYTKIINEAKKVNPNVGIVEVENVNQAIYQLGLESRKRNIQKPVIAVTGSVGKTTLCSLISKVLETEIKVLHDFKNQNNNTKWHVARDLLEFENYDMAVIEVGISEKKVMTKLSQLTKPSICVINSIGLQHLNNLKNKETVLEEKLHITDFIKDKKILFVNTEDPYLQNLKETNLYKLRQYNVKEAYEIEEQNGILEFKTKIYGKETKFTLKLYGKHHITNIILAIKIAEIYQISYENIVKAIQEFKPVEGRLKVLKNQARDIIVIDDAYNFSIEAIKLGLETAKKQQSKRKIAVIGEMSALGDEAKKIHQELGKYLETLKLDAIYVMGNNTKYYGELEQLKSFETIEELIKCLDKTIQEGDLIYIKASNAQNFNKIVNYLIEKCEVK